VKFAVVGGMAARLHERGPLDLCLVPTGFSDGDDSLSEHGSVILDAQCCGWLVTADCPCSVSSCGFQRIPATSQQLFEVRSQPLGGIRLGPGPRFFVFSRPSCATMSEGEHHEGGAL
jgi:hypothetical protein